jgi:hypothetical protein
MHLAHQAAARLVSAGCIPSLEEMHLTHPAATSAETRNLPETYQISRRLDNVAFVPLSNKTKKRGQRQRKLAHQAASREDNIGPSVHLISNETTPDSPGLRPIQTDTAETSLAAAATPTIADDDENEEGDELAPAKGTYPASQSLFESNKPVKRSQHCVLSQDSAASSLASSSPPAPNNSIMPVTSTSSLLGMAGAWDSLGTLGRTTAPGGTVSGTEGIVTFYLTNTAVGQTSPALSVAAALSNSVSSDEPQIPTDAIEMILTRIPWDQISRCASINIT